MKSTKKIAVILIIGSSLIILSILVFYQRHTSYIEKTEQDENHVEIVVDGRVVDIDDIQSFQVRESHQIFETPPTAIYSESIGDLIQIDIFEIDISSKSGGLLNDTQLSKLSHIKLDGLSIYFPGYETIQGRVFENMLNVLTVEPETNQAGFVGRSRYAIPLSNGLARKITVRYVSKEKIGMQEYEFMLYRIYQIVSNLESYK